MKMFEMSSSTIVLIGGQVLSLAVNCELIADRTFGPQVRIFIQLSQMLFA
jgi:hypothetical protein